MPVFSNQDLVGWKHKQKCYLHQAIKSMLVINIEVCFVMATLNLAKKADKHVNSKCVSRNFDLVKISSYLRNVTIIGAYWKTEQVSRIHAV